MNTKTFSIATLGCKTNIAESEAIIDLLIDHGYKYVEFESQADFYIINTCTVTAMSDKKSRQLIRRAKNRNPLSKVIAIGCYVQTAPEEVKSVEGLDFVVGTSRKSEILNILNGTCSDVVIKDVFTIDEFEDLSIKTNLNHTRAYIKIQEGCTQFCSYCIIPYARGKARSRNLGSIVNEVRALAKQGFKEFLITGTHIGSYGIDLINTNLVDVLEALEEVDSDFRIRLGSVEPSLFTEENIRRMAKISKLCDHFHLSLQSGSDTVLKRMNRLYTSSEYYEAVKKIRKVFPNCGITTDIIVGFPGESTEEFNETVNFVRRIGFLDVHLFPFSPRKGTPAYDFEGEISSDVKKHRMNALKIVCKSTRETFLKSQMNIEHEVLFEDTNSGYTSNYIKLICEDAKPGELKKVKFLSFSQVQESNISEGNEE